MRSYKKKTVYILTTLNLVLGAQWCRLVWVFDLRLGGKWFEARGPFLESPDNVSGPESYFMHAIFTLKTHIFLVLKAEL